MPLQKNELDYCFCCEKLSQNKYKMSSQKFNQLVNMSTLVIITYHLATNLSAIQIVIEKGLECEKNILRKKCLKYSFYHM